MAAISHNHIARAIYLASKDKPAGEVSLVLKNVTRFLDRKRLLSKAPQILERLTEIIDKEAGRERVKVSSHDKLSEKVKKAITGLVEKRYSIQEVLLEERLDDRLLGGFKLEIGDEVIDLTLKNKIQKLQEHLTHA